MGLLDRLGATLGVADALPESVREEIALALAFADRGDLSAAEERLAEIARNNPRLAPVLTALGDVRARRGDDEAAVEAYGRAVDGDKGELAAWLGLGEALVRLRRPDPARDAFRRVLGGTRDPALRARAHAGRGRLALSSGQIAKAVRELRRSLELAPGVAAVEAELGRALVRAGEREGWQWLNRAAQSTIAAGSPDVALVVEAADAAPQAEVAEALLRSARQALTAEGPAPRARLDATLARILARSGRLTEARPLAADAIARAPEEAAAVGAWRAVAEAAGDHAEAIRAAARERELGTPLSLETFVRLALGAGDPAALARAVEGAAADDPLAAAVRRFLAGDAREDDLIALAALAPDDAAAAFVARAVSPGQPPAGNLFALLAYARDLAARTAELAALLPAASRAAEAVDRPLLVAVMGEFNAGKSSFVNALVGDEVAPVGVTPTTATINVLRHGPPGARVLYQDGRAQELGAAEATSFLAALDDEHATAVRMVELFFPLEILERMEIVDTPGLNSLRPEHERVARGFLTEADAIVWVFAVGQAAKATEREALTLAQGAGKRILGVLNKADQASAEEIGAVEEHVRSSMGDRIEALVALSARNALRARRAGDAAALQASNLPAVQAALEERFFHEARALKRTTALGALRRFLDDARAHVAPLPDSAAPPDGALDAAERAVQAALAVERTALKARLEAAFRQVAADVLELARPRWPFGDPQTSADDEEFVRDALEDAVTRATEVTRRTLDDAARGGPPLPIAVSVEAFRAFARGVLSGGMVERFLRDDLTGGGLRPDPATVQRALARRVPDVEGELFVPLSAAAATAYAAARRAREEASRRAAVRALVRRERLEAPLSALEAAVAALAAEP